MQRPSIVRPTLRTPQLEPPWLMPIGDPIIQWALDLVRQDSTFARTSVVNVWGYVGDPSAINPPRLISVPAGVQAIEGGRWIDTVPEGAALGSGTVANPSDVSNASWIKGGACVAVQDLPGGGSTVSGLSGHLVDYLFDSTVDTSGKQIEPTIEMSQITPTGSVSIVHEQGDVFGRWDIDVSKVSTSRETITRDHQSVTIINEFVLHPATNTIGPVLTYASGAGPISIGVWLFDMLLVEPIFLTTKTDGTTLNPFTIKSTPKGLVRVFTAYPTHEVATPYADGFQVAIKTSAGNRVYMTSDGGTSDATAPVVTDLDIGSTVTDNDITWTVEGYATGLAEVLEDASENEITDSREFDAASWVDSGLDTNIANETGIDGGANLAYTLQDNQATFQFLSDTITVVNDANTNSFRLYIKKDNDETRFPALRIVHKTGGVTKNESVMLNTKTGAIADSEGTPGSSCVDIGGWWALTISSANNNPGNTDMLAQIYPAGGTVLGTLSAVATGSIIVDQADVRLDKSFVDSPIITSGSSVVRDDTELTDLTAGVISNDSMAGSITCVINGEGQTNNFLWTSVFDAANRLLLVTGPTNTFFYKVVGNSFTEVAASLFTYTSGVPFTVDFSHDTVDSTRIRAYNVGDTKEAWKVDVGANLDPAVIGSTHEIGANHGAGGGNAMNMEVISLQLSINKEDLGFE